MQVNVAMLRQKRIDALGLVRRKVIRNDVDLFASALVHHDIREKRHELRRRVAVRGLAQHSAIWR